MKNAKKDIHLRELDGEPIIRVGIVEGQDYIDFKVSGEFSIHDSDDNPLISNINSNLKWRVKIKDSKPGQQSFYLILEESFDQAKIEKRLEIAQRIDPSAKIENTGGDVYLSGSKITNNSKFILVCGEYDTVEEAKRDFTRFEPEFNPTISKETSKQPRGLIEFFDSEYDHSGESKNYFRIVPTNVKTQSKLYSIKSFDEILQREHYNDRIYNGTLEFRLDNRGKLMVVSDIPLESYLKRVVYSETGTDLGEEFIKSIAIVTRSEVLARINHKHLGDPYDMCDWGHCLRYYGEKFDDRNIDTAVDETRGMVLYAEGNICDANFNLICGGHTDDATAVWQNDTATPSHAKYDWKEDQNEKFGNLDKEQKVRNWILGRPDSFCNLMGRKVPASLESLKKFFRWEVDYSRKELEDLICKKTGEDIGVLFDIIPVQRGKSGRLKEIELIGSLKNYRIRDELKIRESLAYDYLESSCFIIEKELDDIGTPISFNLVGAGQGHGVGMCKTGAAVMATEGYDVFGILKHYFENTEIKSIYEVD